MKRKVICTGVALLLAGCLLASCGENGGTESEGSSAPSVAVSSEESSHGASYGASYGATSSEENSYGAVSEVTSETTSEVTSDESASETTSEEPAPEPFVPTPMPEGLPGIDSPQPPRETRYVLPAKGWMKTDLVELFPLTYTFTYGKNTMVIEEASDQGTYSRIEYRFDDRARPVEVISDTREDQWGGSLSRTVYTYDEAGRLIQWFTTAESEEGTSINHSDWSYGEDGRLSGQTHSSVSAYGSAYSRSYTYERTYDETGAITELVEVEIYLGEIRETVKHRYEDGREVLRQCFQADGTLYEASTFDYDENGLLVRERCRRGADVYTDTYYYEGGELIEIRRDDGDGVTPLLCYAYDAYGRLTAAIEKMHHGYYEVHSYAENGCLSEVAGYYYHEKDDGFLQVLDLAVTAWGDKAVTEMQLAFYRTAMGHLLGGWGVQGAQFSAMEEPKP